MIINTFESRINTSWNLSKYPRYISQNWLYSYCYNIDKNKILNQYTNGGSVQNYRKANSKRRR